MKGQRGVTLVALVITVIVMLILAGVAISALTANDGLFQKTSKAADLYNTASQDEKDKMDHLEDYIDEKFRQLNITVD